jgi:hypothetical protein
MIIKRKNMNTYTYEIVNLYTTNDNPDRVNDVAKVLVLITATSPDGLERQLNCMFNMSPGETFTEFSELTDQQVREWVDASAQWPYYQRELDAMLNPQPMFELDPPKSPPWMPTQEQSIAEFQGQTVDETTSSNTTTVIVSDTLRAAVLQVLQEMENTQVQSSQDPV